MAPAAPGSRKTVTSHGTFARKFEPESTHVMNKASSDVLLNLKPSLVDERANGNDSETDAASVAQLNDASDTETSKDNGRCVDRDSSSGMVGRSLCSLAFSSSRWRFAQQVANRSLDQWPGCIVNRDNRMGPTSTDEVKLARNPAPHKDGAIAGAVDSEALSKVHPKLSGLQALNRRRGMLALTCRFGRLPIVVQVRIHLRGASGPSSNTETNP
jgi:hypothetical protein